jgi:hypothetical protein
MRGGRNAFSFVSCVPEHDARSAPQRAKAYKNPFFINKLDFIVAFRPIGACAPIGRNIMVGIIKG